MNNYDVVITKEYVGFSNTVFFTIDGNIYVENHKVGKWYPGHISYNEKMLAWTGISKLYLVICAKSLMAIKDDVFDSVADKSHLDYCNRKIKEIQESINNTKTSLSIKEKELKEMLEEKENTMKSIQEEVNTLKGTWTIK